MTRGRKRENIRLTTERDFPHLVELVLPPEGFITKGSFQAASLVTGAYAGFLGAGISRTSCPSAPSSRAQ